MILFMTLVKVRGLSSPASIPAPSAQIWA